MLWYTGLALYTKKIERDTVSYLIKSSFVLHDLTGTFLGQEYFALCAAQQEALELNMLWKTATEKTQPQGSTATCAITVEGLTFSCFSPA